jgi:hypothetical protein
MRLYSVKVTSYDMPVGDFDGDGRDDLGAYQPDTVDIDLSLSAKDTGGIPVSMAEYCLLL